MLDAWRSRQSLPGVVIRTLRGVGQSFERNIEVCPHCAGTPAPQYFLMKVIQAAVARSKYQWAARCGGRKPAPISSVASEGHNMEREEVNQNEGTSPAGDRGAGGAHRSESGERAAELRRSARQPGQRDSGVRGPAWQSGRQLIQSRIPAQVFEERIIFGARP